MKPYPPLGILYLSAYLEQNNFEHDVFDTTFSSKHLFKEYLLEKRPTFLAFYVNLMTKVNVVQIIQFVKSEPSLKDTKIILGGPDIRYNKENLLNSKADFLVIGEGEESFLESNTPTKTQPVLSFESSPPFMLNSTVILLSVTFDDKAFARIV